MAKGKHLQSRQIIQSLVEGVDPATGEDLPKDTVLHRSDVMRALLAVITALESIAAREARRSLLPASVGKPWTLPRNRNSPRHFREAMRSDICHSSRTNDSSH